MTSERKCALLLHGLAEHDRSWLLEQLPDVQRGRLGALLEELAALRIAPQSGSAPPAPAAPCAPPGLDAEPAWVLAAVLDSGDWPWAAALLSGLTAERRAAVAAARRHDIAPRLKALLRERVAAMPTGTAPPVRAPSGWKERVRRWLK